MERGLHLYANDPTRGVVHAMRRTTSREGWEIMCLPGYCTCHVEPSLDLALPLCPVCAADEALYDDTLDQEATR